MRAVCVAVLLLCGAALCSAVNIAHLRNEARSEVNDQAEYLVSPFTPEHEVVNCLAMKAALAAEKPIAKFKVIEDAFKGTCDGHAGITKDQATGIFGWAAFKSQSLADQIETSNALGSRWQDAPCEGSADATFNPDKNLCTDLSRIAVGGGVAKLGEMIKQDEVVAFGHQAFTGLAHVSHLGWGSLWHSQSSPEEKKQFKLKTQRDIVSQIATQAKAWLTHALGKTDPESMILPRWSWNMGRIGHMLADSFSCAHVARLETGEVLFHQDYNFQSGIEHGKHDALGKSFQTHNGVKMAIKHNTEIYKFGIRALNAKYSGAKDAASKVSQASAQMANYIKDHIFKFASPDHGNFDALGCVVKSTVDPAKLASFKAHICPLKLGSYDAKGKNICPDRPRKAETELEGAAAAPAPASNKVTENIIPSTCFKEGKTYWQKMDGDCEHKVSITSPTCSKNGDCKPVKGANKCEHRCVCGTKGINECFCVKSVSAKQLKAACIGEPKDLN